MPITVCSIPRMLSNQTAAPIKIRMFTETLIFLLPEKIRLKNIGTITTKKIKEPINKSLVSLGSIAFINLNSAFLIIDKSHWQGHLVNSRNQSIVHSPRIVAITRQLFLKCLIFQNGSNHQDDQCKRRRNKCPHRT